MISSNFFPTPITVIDRMMQPLMQEKIPLNLPAGESKVELLYAKQHKDVGRPITVYYCRLALQPRVVPQGK